MPNKRRTYTFADRATAEAECRRQGELAARYRLAMQEAIAGRIEWIRGGCYDAGRVDGGVILVTFHGRNLDQEPSTTAYTSEEVSDWRRSLMSQGQEERELARTLGDALVAHDAAQRKAGA